MPSLTVLLIRHAEKPGPAKLGRGLTPEGKEDKHSLVIRGWQRAGAWAALFGSKTARHDFPRPDFIFAADPKQAPSPDGTRSKRPYETIMPLSRRLKRAAITKYGVGDEAKLVEQLLQLTGVVLVCWEHKRIISAILPKLTENQKLPDLPTAWNRNRFDVVLRFHRKHAGARWKFRQLFPKLLDGDLSVSVAKSRA
jgi:hypothetical protein